MSVFENEEKLDKAGIPLWNAVNTVIHYFTYDGKKKTSQFCFNVWCSEEGIIRKAVDNPEYIGKPIQALIADYPEYNHHKIDLYEKSNPNCWSIRKRKKNASNSFFRKIL